MNTKQQKGIQSKLSVMKHFTDDGYFVYNETNNSGPVDFVAIKIDTGEVRLIEVKSMSFRSQDANWRPGTMINRNLTPIQKKLGVELVYCNLETGDIKHGLKKSS